MTQRDREYEALRAALEELRAGDEGETPAFDAILRLRASRRSLERRQLRRLALAAGLAVAAGLMVATGIGYRAVIARGDRLTVPREVVSLSAWRPASDVLLETPVRDLLKAPQLGASLINTGIPGDLR